MAVLYQTSVHRVVQKNVSTPSAAADGVLSAHTCWGKIGLHAEAELFLHFAEEVVEGDVQVAGVLD